MNTKHTIKHAFICFLSIFTFYLNGMDQSNQYHTRQLNEQQCNDITAQIVYTKERAYEKKQKNNWQQLNAIELCLAQLEQRQYQNNGQVTSDTPQILSFNSNSSNE